jgi:hypothetical protein
MLFQIPERQFEEAGRDPVQFEKLLLRARKEVKFAFTSILVFAGVLLIPIVWLSIFMFQSFQLLRAGHFDLASKSLDKISWITNFKPMLVTCGFMLYLVATLLIVAIREADARVKMLLLFRGLRDAKASGGDAGAS